MLTSVLEAEIGVGVVVREGAEAIGDVRAVGIEGAMDGVVEG